MMIRRVVSVVLGASLLGAPVTASAVERTPAPVDQAEQISGVAPWIWVLGAAIAIGLLIILLDDDDEEPVSP